MLYRKLNILCKSIFFKKKIYVELDFYVGLVLINYFFWFFNFVGDVIIGMIG